MSISKLQSLVCLCSKPAQACFLDPFDKQASLSNAKLAIKLAKFI